MLTKGDTSCNMHTLIFVLCTDKVEIHPSNGDCQTLHNPKVFRKNKELTKDYLTSVSTKSKNVLKFAEDFRVV